MKFFRRSTAEVNPAADAQAVAVVPPPPANAVELGLRLRAARERLGLRLEDVRDEIDVPLVDLDALERGALETLHTQQAAVVALWRYAERLGLEPRELAGVLNAHWPNRGLAVNAIASRRGFTPLAELRSAVQLLTPISDPGSLRKTTLGLSESTRSLLDDGSAKHLTALQLLAPVNAVRRLRVDSQDAAALPAGPDTEADATALAPAARLSEDPAQSASNAARVEDEATVAEFAAATAEPAAEGDPTAAGDELATGSEGADRESPATEPTTERGWANVQVEVEVEVEGPAARATEPSSPDAAQMAGPEAQTPAGDLEGEADEPVQRTVPTGRAPTASGSRDAVPSVAAAPLPRRAAPPVGSRSTSIAPNLTVLFGDSERRSKWMRSVGRRLAERFGMTAEEAEAVRRLEP